MKKKFGLLLAISLVIGIVIGSGIFFKADDTIIYTNGNVKLAIFAWFIGGLIMLFAALSLSLFASRIEECNGLVDYFEHAYGRFAAYLMGWFQLHVYYTPLSAILAYVSSVYTLTLFYYNNPASSYLTWGLAFVYLVVMYCINYYTPFLAAKFQVSSTFVKLVPLILIGVIGTITGVLNDVTLSNVPKIASKNLGGGSFASAIVACSFAYEGWQIATTVNSEIKNSKKNLPIALVVGAFVIVSVYILFLVGINLAMTPSQILEQGDNAVTYAAKIIFGNTFASLITVFVVISCLGTLNGIVMSIIRIPYSLAIRGNGILPKKIILKNKAIDMPYNSAMYGFIVSFIYFIVWYCSLNNVFGKYIALDEIPIVLAYISYLFLYVHIIRKFDELSFIKRYVIPIIAFVGTTVVIYGGITNPNIGMYMILSMLLIAIGIPFYKNKSHL